MLQLIAFGPSKRKTKKMTLEILDGDKLLKIHFGAKGSTTYVEGASDKKRENYLKRHMVNEDWSKISPGSASAHILWGDSTSVQKNLKSFLKRYKIKDRR